jgi:CRP-like cAMP-binding protein
MVTIKDLKRIPIFNDMSDERLEKIKEIAMIKTFRENEHIYEPGMAAENLYILKKGKVVLEGRLSQSMTISFASIKPGYSFGWQAIISGATYSSFAVSVENSDVIAIPAAELIKCLDQDPIMGYTFMKALTAILIKRLDQRETRLLRLLSRHPDLEIFLDKDKEEEIE